MATLTSSSLLNTLNKSLTSRYGGRNFFNFTWSPDLTEAEKISALTSLSSTNLNLLLVIEHDNTKYISTIPPIGNTDITFYKVFTEYQGVSGNTILWQTNETVWPKIIGTKTPQGTFGVDGLSAHWVIQEDETYYAAVNSRQGNPVDSPFFFPYDSWKRFTGKDVLFGADGSPLVSLSGGEYITTSSSFDETIPFDQNENYTDLHITRHTDNITFRFTKNNNKQILVDTNAGSLEKMNFYYATKLFDGVENDTLMSAATIIQGAPVDMSTFSSIDRYVQVTQTYNPNYVRDNSSILIYATEDQTAEERISVLKTLGYL